MNNKPLLSVIIPVYNAEKRLEISLNSILNQTYQNLEIIVVDDGSTDKSDEILKKYSEKDSRIKVYTKKNSGVSATRNLGVDKASGEIITFFDADDTLETNTYEDGVKYYVDNNLDILMYGLNYEYFDGENLVRLKEYSFDEDLLIEKKELNRYFVNLYQNKYIAPVWNKLFSAELIRDNELYFNTGLAVLEDMEYVINYLEYSDRIGILAESFVHYYHDVSKHDLQRRAVIDYLTGFKALDKKFRNFCKLIGINDEKSLAYLNSVIFEFYLIHIKKIFVNEESFKIRMQKIKEFNSDVDVSRAAKQAVPLRRNISLMKFLVEKRLNMLLYITIDSWVKRIS